MFKKSNFLIKISIITLLISITFTTTIFATEIYPQNNENNEEIENENEEDEIDNKDDEENENDEDETENENEKEEKLEPVPPFSDVNKENPYYISINYLRENNIIKGYQDGTFRPFQEINRSETLKMLTLITGVFSEEDFENIDDFDKEPFLDTASHIWYTPYLQSAKDLEIIHGYPDGTFRPYNCINLADTLKIFFLALDKELDLPNTDFLYNDTPENEWFTPFTSFAASKNIINIYNSNTVNPGQKMIRGYLAEIIYRYEMSKLGYNFGKATFYGSVFHGRRTASGDTFDKNAFTAAHKTLPFGTEVEVTNLANGKSVIVRINDRGPYGPGRVIDLSSNAFSKLAPLSRGVINVQYKIISHP